MTPDPIPRPNARGRRTARADFDPPTLRVLRSDARLSREDLAEQAGLSVSSIKMWETGNRVPTVSAASKLASALGVDLAALSGSDEPFDPARYSLRAIRTKFELTVPEVARAAGTNDDLIYDVELGHRLPPDPAVWARAYRITPEQLMRSWALGYSRSEEQPEPGEQAEQA